MQALRPSEGLLCWRKGALDAAIPDVMLPEMDGFELCCSIRRTSSIPLIMLTARGEVMDRCGGAGTGCRRLPAQAFRAA